MGNKRGAGIPLEQRVRVGQNIARDIGRAAPRPAEPLYIPQRHCWVLDPVDGRGGRRPGVLVAWRQDDGRWQGRVVYAALLRPDAWVLVDEWLPAELLTAL